MNTFNPTTAKQVYVRGRLDDPQLEQRVNNVKERGYEEIARQTEQKVYKTFNKRMCYRSTHEYDRVVVVLRKVGP